MDTDDGEVPISFFAKTSAKHITPCQTHLDHPGIEAHRCPVYDDEGERISSFIRILYNHDCNGTFLQLSSTRIGYPSTTVDSTDTGNNYRL